MFTGLSAFPITPFKNETIDFKAFEMLVSKLSKAKVDSICAMGSTGLYPYLQRDEVFRIAKAAVEGAGNIPVMAGIGALRTKDVLANAVAAQEAGVSAVLLAPVSYHRLNEAEVFSLYQQVCAELSVPLCVYENVVTTNFTFSEAFFAEVATLPQVGAIKLSGAPFATQQGERQLAQLRKLLPNNVAIGVSADPYGAAGMAAGCDLWLSVIGGLFPNTAKKILAAAKNQTREQALEASNQLNVIWNLFTKNRGGMRVVATAANILGYAESDCLPAPLKLLNRADRDTLEKWLKQTALD